MTKATLYFRSGFVIVVSVALLISLDSINEWIGDWGALFWVCSTLLFPWFTGIAFGTRFSPLRGRIVGVLLAVMVVLIPLSLFVVTSLQDPNDTQVLVAATLFCSVAAVNGAMAYPVGVRVRRREKT